MRGIPALLAVSAVVLTACSSTTSVRQSEHDQTGDTFVASGRYTDSIAGMLIAQNEVLGQAREFCDGQGRRFDVLQDQVSAANSAYVVRFRCLALDDPRVQRPAVNQAPDELF